MALSNQRLAAAVRDAEPLRERTSGPGRLRAAAMKALLVALGLLNSALVGSEVTLPLAWAIVHGLITSIVMTLTILVAVSSFLARALDRLRSVRGLGLLGRLSLIVSLASVACRVVPAGEPPAWNHPPAFVGEWIDLRHVAGADTSVWDLRADGSDWLRRITGRRITNHQYGHWFVETFRDTTRLCVVRPGPHQPRCGRPTIDTVEWNGGRRARLTLAGYSDALTRADRFLVRRIP